MEDESRICSRSPQSLSAFSATSKANHGEDATNSIASKDAINGRKEGPGNILLLNLSPFPAEFVLKTVKLGKRAKCSKCLLPDSYSNSQLSPGNGTENMSTLYLCLHFPQTLMSRFEFSQKQTLMKGSELKRLIWEVIIGNRVKRVRK